MRAVLFRRARRDAHHATALVAVSRRKAAREEFDPVNRVDIKDAQRPFVEILQVEGLEYLEAIEENECLVVPPAPNGELGTVVAGREPRQSIHGAKEVLTERCLFDPCAGNSLPSCRSRLQEGEGTRSNGDRR